MARVEHPSADPRAWSQPAAGATLMLALQRSAGNAAVLDLVQRAIGLQRAPAATKGKKPGKPKVSKRPVLRLGDGPTAHIAQLQQSLNAAIGSGNPLRVTAVFDGDTEAAVKKFQTMNPPLKVTGVATKATWTRLEAKAKRVVRQGRRVYLGPGTGEARGSLDAGTIHPTIKLGSKGPAVQELQQKLNTIPGSQVPGFLTDHAKFDKATRSAVIAFQKSRKPPLSATGVVGKGTWAALDAVAGPVKVGRESYEWSQRAEGTITGSSTRFTWRLLPDKLQVTVNIKFTGASKHPMVATWRKDITDVWNGFKFVDKAHAGRELKLEFVVGQGSPVDATVKVHKTPANAKEIPRSDASNFHTGDTRKGLAPHEFGHLIGLQDEYNKGPEAYTVVTGEQPLYGEIEAPKDGSGNPVLPEVIATEMRKSVGGNKKTRGKRALAVVKKYGLKQGAFAQRVALAYEKANAGNLLREDWKPSSGYVNVKDPSGTMGNDLAARIPGRFSSAPEEAEVLEPFLYSNRGIMGTMEEVETPKGYDAHDHPVAERHVRHFLQIVQANKPGSWRTVR